MFNFIKLPFFKEKKKEIEYEYNICIHMEGLAYPLTIDSDSLEKAEAKIEELYIALEHRLSAPNSSNAIYRVSGKNQSKMMIMLDHVCGIIMHENQIKER
jgi:hypothetical protein